MSRPLLIGSELANARERSAHLEAIGHLTKGLEVLKTLPETTNRAHQELAIHVALGPAWMAIEGQGSSNVAQVYTRARVLCQQLGDTPQLFPALHGVWLFALVHEPLQTAQELAEQLFRLAQVSHDPTQLIVAHRALSTTYLYRGELTLAHTHTQQGRTLYDPQQHRSLAFLYGFDPGIACLAHGAIVLWLLGTPDQALVWSYAALANVQDLAHPPSLALVLHVITLVQQFLHAPQVAYTQARALIALSTEHRLALYLAVGTIFQGWALAAQGQAAEALVQMQEGIDAKCATGAVMLLQPYFLTLLAETLAQVGQCEEGLRLLTEAQQVLETSGERWWEAEVYRLRGELLLQSARPDTSQAETSIRQALAVARRQGAKSLELRAAMSLSRLWQRQGKQDEARQLLAEVYNWFTEGFDTADLQEAKALLDELAG